MQGNYILSFLGAAPMNDPKAVVYLAIDNPKNTIQYWGRCSRTNGRRNIRTNITTFKCKERL